MCHVRFSSTPNFSDRRCRRPRLAHFTMVGHKRPRDATTTSESQRKKPKVSLEIPENVPGSILRAEEVDFPRGGGTSLTAVEYKKIRSEGLREAKEEAFSVSWADYRP